MERDAFASQMETIIGQVVIDGLYPIFPENCQVATGLLLNFFVWIFFFENYLMRFRDVRMRDRELGHFSFVGKVFLPLKNHIFRFLVRPSLP